MQLRDDERFIPADELPPGLYDRVRALVNAAEVREGHTVPWLAGRSVDGKRLYPDVGLPFEVAGVKTRRSTGFHELGEWLMMNEGHTYDKDSAPPGDAHYIANGVEKLEVEAQGGAWEPYCLGFRPLIKQTDDPALTNLPPKADWDRRPYQDDDPTLAAEIDAADKPTKVAKAKEPTMGEPNAELKLFIPITKIDAAKRLVYGVATAEKPDLSGEVCDYATTKPNYEKWSAQFEKATDGKSLGNLRAMHGKVAAGKLIQLGFNDEARQIEICGKVVDDAEWQKVDEGVYTGFSQGGRYVKRWQDPDDPKLMRYTADPSEVSLVDHPCLPDATFAVIKADGATEMRKFKAAVAAPAGEKPSMADIAVKAVALALAAGDESKWANFVEQATIELTKAAGAPATKAVDGATTAAPGATAVAGPRDDRGQQVWINKRLPGQTFETEAAMQEALVKAAAAELVQKMSAPMLAALTALRDSKGGTPPAKAAPEGKTVDLGALGKQLLELGIQSADDLIRLPATLMAKIEAIDPGLAKKSYSADERKDMAAKGEAKKDGSYPIKTADDVANAVKDWIRSKGSASDRRHIIKRAKALKATDQLPADWPGSTKKDDAGKAAGDGDLAKAASLYSVSNLLLLLDSIQQAEDYAESRAWGFGPSVALPKELTDRFGAALVELGDIAVEMLDAVLGSIKDEETSEAVANAARAGDLIKLALAKKGARHSKADKERIRQGHDALTALDPDCCPGADNSADGDGDAEKLAKRLSAERDEFKKQLDGMMALLNQIADQPMPMGSTSVRVVEKTQDSSFAHGAQAQTLLEQPGALEVLADLAIRKAQAQPMYTAPGFRPPPR